MFKLFCKHEYKLYKEGNEFVHHGYEGKGCWRNEYIYHFVCMKCERTLDISADEVKAELRSIKDEHYKKEALGKPLPLSSSIVLTTWEFPKGETFIEGMSVTELMERFKKRGIDVNVFKWKVKE